MKREDTQISRKSSVKYHTLEYSQRTGAVTMIQRTQIGLQTEKKKKMWKCTWTYVRFFCRSFASVSEAVVLLPQCSRSSLSRLLLPAAIVASPRSSADLWTKRTCGILWLDSAHNRISVWCSCGQPAIWGTFWGFVCFNAHFVVKIGFLLSPIKENRIYILRKREEPASVLLINIYSSWIIFVKHVINIFFI